MRQVRFNSRVRRIGNAYYVLIPAADAARLQQGLIVQDLRGLAVTVEVEV